MPWWPWQRDRPTPLPRVLTPEAPGRKQGSYLSSILAESRSVLDTDAASFELVDGRREFKILSRPVADGKGLTMARLEAVVPIQPETLFKLMTSMDGKMVIDPFPREHHSELVQTLKMPQGQAEVVYSEAPRFIGMLRPREYVTCDASAPKERLFVCKSCEAAEGPLAAGAARGRVRANLLFAMRMREAAGRPGWSELQMINWLDLGRDTVPVWLANTITERWFFQGVMRRLKKYAQVHEITPATPPDALQLQPRNKVYQPAAGGAARGSGGKR